MVSLEQVGGLELHRLWLPNLNALGRLRSIGGAEGGLTGQAATQRISGCQQLINRPGSGRWSGWIGSSCIDNPTLVSSAGMTSLRELGALHSEGTSLRLLEGISPIRELTVVSSRLRHLSELGSVPQLRRLHLKNNEVLLSLRGATFPREMDAITLQGNPVLNDLSALDSVVALEGLSLE